MFQNLGRKDLFEKYVSPYLCRPENGSSYMEVREWIGSSVG